MKILGREPALYLFAINALVALFVAYGLDLTQVQVGAVSTFATAGFAVATAIMTRPVDVAAVTGAVGTGLTAAAAFGLELSAEQIGATVTALSVVLALILRVNVTPIAPPRST
jgi:hypothetical protein